MLALQALKVRLPLPMRARSWLAVAAWCSVRAGAFFTPGALPISVPPPCAIENADPVAVSACWLPWMMSAVA